MGMIDTLYKLWDGLSIFCTGITATKSLEVGTKIAYNCYCNRMEYR